MGSLAQIAAGSRSAAQQATGIAGSGSAVPAAGGVGFRV